MMGNTMETGLLAEWVVGEGEPVETDQVVAVVESETAAADVVANQDGTLARVDVEVGEEVPPGTLVGVVLGPDEDVSDAPPRSRVEPGGGDGERGRSASERGSDAGAGGEGRQTRLDRTDGAVRGDERPTSTIGKSAPPRACGGLPRRRASTSVPWRGRVPTGRSSSPTWRSASTPPNRRPRPAGRSSPRYPSVRARTRRRSRSRRGNRSGRPGDGVGRPRGRRGGRRGGGVHAETDSTTCEATTERPSGVAGPPPVTRRGSASPSRRSGNSRGSAGRSRSGRRARRARPRR